MQKLMNKDEMKKWMSNFLLIFACIISYKVVMDINQIGNWFLSLRNVLSPFILGFGIAYLLNIPCKKIRSLLEKINLRFIRKHSRGLSILITYLIILIVVNIVLSIILPIMYRNIVEFIKEFPAFYVSGMENIVEQRNNGVFPYTMIPADFLSSLEYTNLFSTSNIKAVLSQLSSVITLSSAVFTFALAIISSVYYLLEVDKFKYFMARALKVVFSEDKLNVFFKYAKNTNEYFNSFLYCLFLDAFIYGCISTIGLTLCGVTYSVVLGPLLGLFNLIPYFGAIFMSIVSIIVVCFTQGLGMGVVAAVFLIVSQQIDGNIIQPKLLSGSLKLSPVLIIIGITVGGAYMGIIGMIIAIPIVAVIKNILMDIIEYREKKKILRISLDN